MPYVTIPTFIDPATELNLVFIVQRAHSACDMDCWQHWIDNKYLSYHRTRASADAQILKLIEDEIDDLIHRGEAEGERSWDAYDDAIEDVKLNIFESVVGTESDTERVPLFSIVTFPLVD